MGKLLPAVGAQMPSQLMMSHNGTWSQLSVWLLPEGAICLIQCVHLLVLGESWTCSPAATRGSLLLLLGSETIEIKNPLCKLVQVDIGNINLACFCAQAQADCQFHTKQSLLWGNSENCWDTVLPFTQHLWLWFKKDYVNINMEINSSGVFFTYSYLSLLFILYLHLKIVNIFSAKIFIGA